MINISSLINKSCVLISEAKELHDAVVGIIEEVEVRDEIKVQYNVLKALTQGNTLIVDDLIAKYAGVFRDILDDFKVHNMIPTEKDIIDITTDRTGENPFEVAKKMRDATEIKNKSFFI